MNQLKTTNQKHLNNAAKDDVLSEQGLMVPLRQMHLNREY